MKIEFGPINLWDIFAMVGAVGIAWSNISTRLSALENTVKSLLDWHLKVQKNG